MKTYFELPSLTVHICTFLQNAINPASYSISLDSLDGHDENESFPVSEVVREGENSIVLKVVSLYFRRLWSYVVFAHGCKEHPLTNETMELGTVVYQ